MEKDTSNLTKNFNSFISFTANWVLFANWAYLIKIIYKVTHKEMSLKIIYWFQEILLLHNLL